MTSTFDPYGAGERRYGVPGVRREPLDPLLALPDHPSGEWATRPPKRVGHPRAARSPLPLPAQAPPDVPSAPVRTRARPVALLLAVVVLLALAAGWEAYRLEGLAGANDRLAAALAGEQHRAVQLGDRTLRLEKQLAAVFDPEAVSAAVLPSVFRVRAGSFTGTAFAFGDRTDDGDTGLLTNYHVVEDVWSSGGRKVTLERGKERVPATIVKVSKSRDLALLRTGTEIAGLTAAAGPVRPGQQIVVVGAPLGLDDSVSTGVVSALRPGDAPGPTVQFDAPINPGNSGGPVVNAQAEVIGLATAKARDAEGIGLAVPIKTACDTFDLC